jgi:hypothetical protein
VLGDAGVVLRLVLGKTPDKFDGPKQNQDQNQHNHSSTPKAQIMLVNRRFPDLIGQDLGFRSGTNCAGH